MTTLVLGSPPPELEALLERRRRAGVDRLEVLLVDPAERTVTWLALQGGTYEPVQRSGLIELGPTELAERLSWP